jgi:glucan phosphoethanolaminetransferase (alkaline phosphatase superfamily)
MQDIATVRKRAFTEAKKFSMIVGYLWVVFSLFELHTWIVLRQHNLAAGIGYRLGFSIINVIVLGKVIFFAEAMRVAERLRNKPLLYPIIYKSAVFSIILVCFHIVEGVLVGMFHGRTMVQSIPAMSGGGVEGILLVGAIAFIVLMPFFAFREFARIMGEEVVKSLIFRRGTNPRIVQHDNDRVA